MTKFNDLKQDLAKTEEKLTEQMSKSKIERQELETKIKTIKQEMFSIIN